MPFIPFVPCVPFVRNVRLVSWVALRCFPRLFAANDGKHWAVFILAFLQAQYNGNTVCMVGMAMGKVMVTRSLLLLLGVATLPPPTKRWREEAQGANNVPNTTLRISKNETQHCVRRKNGRVWPQGIELSDGPVPPWAIIVNHRP